jgi:hypothetical protein
MSPIWRKEKNEEMLIIFVGINISLYREQMYATLHDLDLLSVAYLF